MNRYQLSCGILLAGLVFLGQAEAKPIKIHWVASNWAAFHGLARQCGERLLAGDDPSSAGYEHSRIWPLHALAKPDGLKVQFYTKQTRISDHAAFDTRLESVDCDILVAAVQLEMMGRDSLQREYEKTFDRLADLAKRKQARLILATYATKLAGEERERGRKRVLAAAAKLGASICTGWDTMRRMRKAHPEVELFDAKVGGHPSRAATYALAFAFYFTVTGKDIESAPLPLQIGDWEPGDEPAAIAESAARAQRRIAWQACNALSDGMPAYQSRAGHPADHLPPYIKQVSGFGERPEWSHDGKRILFVAKPMGEVYELELATGLIRPRTRHFNHFGFTRANYLSNGDILLSGPIESFDVTDREARNEARHHCWLSVLAKDTRSKPVPLGVKAAEGPAVSRHRLKIAWTIRDKQDPGVGEQHAKHFVGEIEYRDGKPTLVNRREVFDSRQLPFRVGKASLETQDFVPPEDRLLLFSAYQIEDGSNTDTMVVDTETGEFENLTRSPDYYDEPEGVFPDGLHTCVEHAPSRGSDWPLCDIFKLKLDGSGRMQRLTHFSDFKGYKGTQGVVSDDGRYLCFQIGKSGDEAGVGYGFFVMDLKAAEKHLGPFRSLAGD